MARVFSSCFNEVTVSIIGTSGRTDTEKLSSDLYKKMVRYAEKYLLRKQFQHVKVRLKSGGAAWSDHVAVTLFLKKESNFSLELQLPCRFEGNRFLDIGYGNFVVNPGRVANYYHEKFSRVIGKNSLSEVRNAIDKGAIVCTKKDFHSRNSEVAKADYLLAFVWNASIPGGTGDTWRKSKAKKSTSYYNRCSLNIPLYSKEGT